MAVAALLICTLATAISIISLTHLARTEHNPRQPRSLSELAAAQEHLLVRFRKILWLCGTLFAIAMYGFIIPTSQYSWWLFIAWSLEYISEASLAAIPARGRTLLLHTALAQIMALGMLGVAYTLCFSLSGTAAHIEITLAVLMTVLATLTFADKRRFLFYELPFIFLSHVSLVVAAAAL